MHMITFFPHWNHLCFLFQKTTQSTSKTEFRKGEERSHLRGHWSQELVRCPCPNSYAQLFVRCLLNTCILTLHNRPWRRENTSRGWGIWKVGKLDVHGAKPRCPWRTLLLCKAALGFIHNYLFTDLAPEHPLQQHRSSYKHHPSGQWLENLMSIKNFTA